MGGEFFFVEVDVTVALHLSGVWSMSGFFAKLCDSSSYLLRGA
jgi:hypothetical protein